MKYHKSIDISEDELGISITYYEGDDYHNVAISYSAELVCSPDKFTGTIFIPNQKATNMDLNALRTLTSEIKEYNVFTVIAAKYATKALIEHYNRVKSRQIKNSNISI